jgi:hypothetical protein
VVEFVADRLTSPLVLVWFGVDRSILLSSLEVLLFSSSHSLKPLLFIKSSGTLIDVGKEVLEQVDRNHPLRLLL